jgi:glycosyltransferase involved in cell wall biosynthesis
LTVSVREEKTRNQKTRTDEVIVQKRLKVLMSAYACEPDRGSEPGIGWSVAREMARYHDIWVMTQTDSRPGIEAEMARNQHGGLQFVYWGLPRTKRFWELGHGERLHYYLWQLRMLGVASALHAKVGFDLVHHVTFGRYWAPSFLCFLGLPFVWGPVGGGESAPRCFWSSGGWRSSLWEGSRELARWVGEHGPFVRATARRSAVALATTDQSASRMRALGCSYIETFLQNGLLDDEIEQLGAIQGKFKDGIRFVSVGKLMQWKGNDISLRALSQADIPGAEYWVIGDGPDRRRLEALASMLGIADRVRFCGSMPRHEVFSCFQNCDALLHPSLHDSGGTATIEAMAAGLPVICLDLGGPGAQVTANSGFKIPAHDPNQASREVASAMTTLARDKELRQRLSSGARDRARRDFRWSSKAERLNAIYHQVLAESNERRLTDGPRAQTSAI